jgi:cell division initiation protein
MTISPVELHHIRLRRGLLGYRRQPVDRLIEEIAESFEEVWRQRADFADRIEQLESELSRHRDLETLLRTTLVSAEKSRTSSRTTPHGRRLSWSTRPTRRPEP